VLVAVEAAFLIAVGAGTWSSSATYLTPTPATATLAADVGSSLVGFGVPSCEVPPTLGILPETNSAFSVHELSAYDPITPKAYFKALKVAPGVPDSALCPVIRSAAEARRYGVGFVLEPRGKAGPPGTVFDAAIGDEDLYRVPRVAAATLTALSPGDKPPGLDATGTPVAVSHPDPSTWTVKTDAPGARVLRLRLTDVPGWHATIDGRPLALQRFSSIMLQATIPAGAHTVELDYWPGTFTFGIVLAACSAAALATALLLGKRRARRSVTAHPRTDVVAEPLWLHEAGTPRS
jgi:hypothetical protein